MPPTCSRPLHDMLVNQTFDWIVCSHAMNSGGVLVVGTFMWAAVFTILLNWTESIYPPMTWSALISGVLFTFLPGDLLMRVVGLVTIIVASVIVMVWHAWRR